MILKNIIPTNILNGLKTYIRNYIDISSLNQIVGYVIANLSNNITSFVSTDTYKKLNCTTREAYFYNGGQFIVENNRIRNNSTFNAFCKLSALVSISGTPSDEIGLAIFNTDVIDSDSVQKLFISGSQPQNIALQTAILIPAFQYVEVWVKNVNSTNSVTTSNISVILEVLEV